MYKQIHIHNKIGLIHRLMMHIYCIHCICETAAAVTKLKVKLLTFYIEFKGLCVVLLHLFVKYKIYDYLLNKTKILTPQMKTTKK